MLVFYFEGLTRSKYTPMLIGAALLAFALLVPFANRLPLSFQRTLSFLPLRLNPIAVYEADNSTEWRLAVWKAAVEVVPTYFWAGKGLAINGEELELTAELQHRGMAAPEEGVMMTGDYHSGPLSVIIPFGIWGVIGWLWFLGASVRAMYLNYRYGDVSLRRVNTFLLAYFIAKILLFLVIYGSFYADVATFAGVVGLNLSLNGGICKPARAPALAKIQSAPPEQLPQPFRPLPGPA